MLIKINILIKTNMLIKKGNKLFGVNILIKKEINYWNKYVIFNDLLQLTYLLQ